MKTYTLKAAGLTRELPLCPVKEHLDIAAFVRNEVMQNVF